MLLIVNITTQMIGTSISMEDTDMILYPSLSVCIMAKSASGGDLQATVREINTLEPA